jgi:hypothetical protein
VPDGFEPRRVELDEEQQRLTHPDLVRYEVVFVSGSG